MLALVLFLALAPTDARVSLVVVHDASAPLTLDVARAAAKYLYGSAPIAARISTAIQEVPLSATCARAAGCEERPDADLLLLVTSIQSGVHLELLDARGIVTASEDVAVDASALVPAVLAPVLDRMIEKAEPASNGASTSGGGRGSSASVSASDDGNSFLPWVLGGLGTCAGICALSTVSACIYGAAADGGNGNDGVNSDGCDIDLGIGDALGGACDGIGDGLGAGVDACGSIGNVASCAVPLAAAATSTAAPPVDDGAPLDARGAMAY